MKQARKRRIKPRNPVAVSPLMKKGGAHQRIDKRAARSRQKAKLRKGLGDE